MNHCLSMGERPALSVSEVSDKSFNPNSNKQKILRSVLFEKGFHFFTGNREYTGITSTSLSEFEEKLKIVNARSVEYHFRRQDFQRWINYVIGDVELATRIARLNKQLSSENLRKELLKIVRKRIRELEKLIGSAV
jgi:alpha-amylase